MMIIFLLLPFIATSVYALPLGNSFDALSLAPGEKLLFTRNTALGKIEISHSAHPFKKALTKRVNGGVDDNHILADGDPDNTPVSYSDTSGMCPFPSPEEFQETSGGAGLNLDLLVSRAGHGMQAGVRYQGTQSFPASNGQTYFGQLDVTVDNDLTYAQGVDLVNLVNGVAADLYDMTNGLGYNKVTMRGLAFGGGFLATWLFARVDGINRLCG